MPTLPILFSRIKHSFHLLAAVDTVLTRCETQLRNNSDLTVFLKFLIAIWWRAVFNLARQYCYVLWQSTWFCACILLRKKPSTDSGADGQHPNRWCTILKCVRLPSRAALSTTSKELYADWHLLTWRSGWEWLAKYSRDGFYPLCQRKEFEVRISARNADEII